VDGNLTNLFEDLNTRVGTIASEVGQTPQGWNGSIFSLIRSLADNVMMPVAGIILSLILSYELISMITAGNNLQSFDTWVFFKFLFKSWVAVYLLSHTFDITMAVFDVGQHIVSNAAGVISNGTSVDITSTIALIDTTMETMELGELVMLALETALISLSMKIMSILITVILYGRMVEIYLYVSVAPIPFSTMVNREWGNIGTNYFRGLFALAIQGFFMMVCVGIYAVLVNSMTISANIHMALFSVAAYTVILCFALFRTNSLAKSVMGAH
jgi:hypothetical protein